MMGGRLGDGGVLDGAADAAIADFHPFGHFLTVLVDG